MMLTLKALLGNYTSSYVQIDFDKMQFTRVFDICELVMEKYRLEGYLIAKSSKHHYHVIFNKKLEWKQVVKIMSWIAIISRSLSVKNYVLLQLIRGESTLRLSTKKNKPIPRVICRKGQTNKGVEKYLATKRWIKNSVL